MEEIGDLMERFIEEVYYAFIDGISGFLTEEQKEAIIAFAYDAEINSGRLI